MAGDLNVGNPTLDLTLVKVIKSGGSDDSSSSESVGKQLTSLWRLKEAVCKHQGEIVQGIYLTLEYHKRLRLAWEENNLQVATDSMHALENASERHFREAWKSTVMFLQGYFKSTRSNYQFHPRICLKGTAASSNGNTIIDIYRGEQLGRSTRSYAVKENTAFASVKRDGKSYICNDIPTAVCESKYINPRLNPAMAIHYCRDGKIKRYFRRKQEICDSWARCWTDYDPTTPINCYRSTLVVPLTLFNNELDGDFVSSTIIGICRDTERTIYGFLCFDHPAVGYFHNDDIAVGYICADLLSFHLMNRQALIHGSRTVEEFCAVHGYNYNHRC